MFALSISFPSIFVTIFLQPFAALRLYNILFLFLLIEQTGEIRSFETRTLYVISRWKPRQIKVYFPIVFNFSKFVVLCFHACPGRCYPSHSRVWTFFSPWNLSSFNYSKKCNKKWVTGENLIKALALAFSFSFPIPFSTFTDSTKYLYSTFVIIYRCDWWTLQDYDKGNNWNCAKS